VRYGECSSAALMPHIFAVCSCSSGARKLQLRDDTEILTFLWPPLWSTGQEFLATDPEVPGPIPGATRFSEKSWIWNGVHSAS
jgi:hypothetical protein